MLPAFEPVMREELAEVMQTVEARIDLLQAQGKRPCDLPGAADVPIPTLPEFLRMPYEAAFGKWPCGQPRQLIEATTSVETCPIITG